MDMLSSRLKVLGLLAFLVLSVAVLHVLSAKDAAQVANADFPQCNDGIDNDNDLKIDYPSDSDCSALDDNTEGAGSSGGVFVALSDGKEEVKPGGSVTYVITLQSARNDVRSVNVEMLLPYQANIISPQDGGRQEGEKVVWTNIAVSPGQTKKLMVNVSIDPTAKEDELMLAEVRVGTGEKAVDTTRVVGQTTTISKPFAISISDDRQYVEPDEMLTYSVVVKNITSSSRSFDLTMQLPQLTVFEGATNNYREDSGTITWKNYSLGAGDTQEFIVHAYVLKAAPDYYALTAKAYVESISAVDTTSVIRAGNLPDLLSVSVTDGLTTVRPDSIVDYEIVISNETNRLATDVTVRNTIPDHADFISASEGGQWTGTDIAWRGLDVSPFGERVLFVKARIRKEAPIGARLRNGVVVGNEQAVDVTEVASTVSRGGNNPGRIIPSNPSSRPSTTGYNDGSPYKKNRLLVRKVADRTEVRPGNSVNFTVYVENTTNHDIRNLKVEDRMDTPYARITNAGRGRQDGNRLEWTIPALAPGEKWQARYTVQIDAKAPHGLTISNVVSISGEGIEEISLTERVHTSKIHVVSQLPETGAGLDSLFLMISGLLGAVPTLGMRRKFL